MSEECQRCGVERDELATVELLDEYDLCDGCVRDIDANIEHYHVEDRYTEEQHERAVQLLSERDETECVINSYEDRQIVVHTPYVSSDVVTDFCDHFGLRILWYGPRWQAEGAWPCADDHGDIFEVVLGYDHDCPPPVPINSVFETAHIDDLDGNDKQF